MSSTIYNHRNLQPTVPNSALQHSSARLNECLETIKQEFDAVLHDSAMLKSQRDDYEVTSQVNELNIIRQALYDLEAQHSRIRQQYEDELLKLRNELHQARQQAHSHNPQHPPGLGPSPSGGPPMPPIPSGSLPGSAPPPPPPSQPQQQQQQPQQPPFGESSYSRGERSDRERERERELRERDRDRERDRERERDLSQRDAKRIKTEKTAAKPERGNEHYLPPQPSHSKSHSTSSQGPPPQQQQQQQQQQPPHMYAPDPQQPSPAPPSLPAQQQVAAYADLDFENIPPEYKKQGPDWLAFFNPRVPRTLDVNLLYTFTHDTVVCCVRFSADGKYLATGCNRSAQIYDIKTGQKTHVLIDSAADKPGDLYIRSVCFSPDGKYLATGAEDKQIRIWDIAKKRIRNVFEGHGQEIYSLDFSADGKLIVSGSGDKTARIWDMDTQRVTVLKIEEPESVDAGITSVAISPDGQLVAAGSLDTVVRIWDVPTGNLIERLQGHKDSVYSVAFQPDGKGLVSGSLDKTLKLWDISPLLRKSVQERTVALPQGGSGASSVNKKEGGERGSLCTMDYKGHRDYVLSVAVSHDGQWIVSGSKDRGVQFWDARSAAVQLTLQGHKNSVISIDLSPTSGLLATGSGDSQARVWRYGPI